MCGVTTAEDAAAAIDAGADLLGLNFVPGTPRVLDFEEAEAVSARAAGQVERVAVFRDADPQTVDETLARIEVEWVQFHGRETPQDVARVGRPTIKAIQGASAEVAATFPDSLLLLDHPVRAAGSGEAWDYREARTLLEAGRKVLLAGGLRPETVGAALRSLGTLPWGVDVASGVEIEKRRKDSDKMKEFVKVVRELEVSP